MSESSVEKTQRQKLPTKKYFYAVGRRKNSIATVRVFLNGSGKILVNGREGMDYFPIFEHHKNILAPIRQVGQEGKMDLFVHVQGGGIRSQADSIVLGISRALTKVNPNFRTSLKKVGFLTRDSRKKERKKPGLKSARARVQWRKR